MAPECDYVSAPSGYDGQVRRVHSCTVANGEAVGRKATAVSTGRHSGVLLHRSVAVSLFGVAAKAGTGRVGTLLQSGERGSLRLPGSGGLDLRGLSTKQAEKFLKQFDTDPHAFKEEFVGRGSISKFDIKMGPGGELHLASKDGSVVIPTGVIPR